MMIDDDCPKIHPEPQTVLPRQGDMAGLPHWGPRLIFRRIVSTTVATATCGVSVWRCAQNCQPALACRDVGKNWQR